MHSNALSVKELVEILSSVPAAELGKSGKKLSTLILNAKDRELDYETLSYVDSDKDGLFDSFEFLLGTDIGEADSDKDGWKDSTEYFKGRNPGNLSDKPSTIIVDGFGNDWFEIIPQKIMSTFL